MKSTFGGWVARQRYLLRLSARECCERSGISKSQWSQIEHKDTPREIATLRKVAVGLGLDLNDVLNASLAAQGIERTTPKDEEPELHDLLPVGMQQGLRQMGDKYRNERR